VTRGERRLQVPLESPLDTWRPLLEAATCRAKVAKSAPTHVPARSRGRSLPSTGIFPSETRHLLSQRFPAKTQVRPYPVLQDCRGRRGTRAYDCQNMASSFAVGGREGTSRFTIRVEPRRRALVAAHSLWRSVQLAAPRMFSPLSRLPAMVAIELANAVRGPPRAPRPSSRESQCRAQPNRIPVSWSAVGGRGHSGATTACWARHAPREQGPGRREFLLQRLGARGEVASS